MTQTETVAEPGTPRPRGSWIRYPIYGIVLFIILALTRQPVGVWYRNWTAEPVDEEATVQAIDVIEPSGLAFHDGRQSFLVVSDEGLLVELSPNWEVRDRHVLGGDLEGVAVHPMTGTIVVADEKAATVFEFDLDMRRILRIWSPDRAKASGLPREGLSNNKIEGVAVVQNPDGTLGLWCVWERSPARVFRMEADLRVEATESARERIRSGLEPERISARVAECFALKPQQLNGITWDSVSGLLLVVSAREQTLTAFTVEGKTVATWRIGPSWAEGVCVMPDGAVILTEENKDRTWTYPKLGLRWRAMKTADPP